MGGPNHKGLYRGIVVRVPVPVCERTMKTLGVMHAAAKIVVILAALLGAASLVMGGEVSPAPLALYGVGGAADVWSTRQTPAGYHRVDGSPFGPVMGPAVTSLAFAGADGLLQATHHHGWARVLRVGYVVGVGAVVVHNRGARPRTDPPPPPPPPKPRT